MNTSPSSGGSGPKGRSHTLRLTLSYEGSNVRLVSRQRVEMVSPQSDAAASRQGQPGFWYEVRDEKDRTLYRRVVQNPLRFAAEIRSDDPEWPLSWQEVRHPRGDFVLLMPDLDAAHALVLFSSPMERGAPPGPAEEIARIDLSQGPATKERG